jgi:hypothetical protein
MLLSKVAKRPLDAELVMTCPGSAAPDLSAFSAAHRQLAAMFVDELGSSAAPLLEAVISCFSAVSAEGGNQGDALHPLNKCPGATC